MSNECSPIKRPVFPYFGGKWRLAKWIIEHFPPHTTYIEPFGGAASVLLNKPRAAGEVYNDINQEVVGVFRILRDPDQAAKLIEQLELTPYSREEYFLSHTPSDDPLEMARRTIVKFHGSFGADCQMPGRMSGFKTGFGGKQSMAWARFPDALRAIVERLQGVTIESLDALDLLRKYDRPECLAFVDPPYLMSTRSGGKVYRHELADGRHRDLAELLRAFSGMVIMSGYPSPLYDSLYEGWHCATHSAWTCMSTPRIEAIWLNPAATAALEKHRARSQSNNP